MKNGPVSVEDADTNMINSASDDSTLSARTVISVANLAGHAKDDSAKRGKLKTESKQDNGYYIDIAKIKDVILSAVTELRNMKEYHHVDGVKCQKVISDVFWDCISERSAIGDYLADLGYAELTITMMKEMNDLGIFKNDDIWFSTYYTYKTCWNYSDASQKLAMCLAKAGIVRLMTLNLVHKAYLDNIHSKNVYYIMKASLSTLHNIARCADVQHYFKEMKTIDAILPLLGSSDDFIKSVAVLLLVYLVNEKSNAKLIEDTNIIQNMVHLLHEALDNKRRERHRGLPPSELAQGLTRLAVQDSYKGTIVEEGALADLVVMLQSMDPKEQAIGAECLWNLSFDKNVKQILKEFPELMVSLESLKDCEHQTVRKNVRGVLWLIKGDNDVLARDLPSSQKSKIHIVVSFSLSEKNLVKKLCTNLTTEGYKIWLDWEQTGTSSLHNMAKAIDNSALVLICISEKYKQSPACRTEAEYAMKIRKDNIFVMLQKNYSPDGWLAVALGAKSVCDFSGKYPFEKPLQDLLKELSTRGVPTGQNHNPSLGEMSASSSGSQAVNTSTTASLPTNVSSLAYNTSINASALISMSNENVGNWLMSKGLQRLISTFSQIDGQLIWQLKRMRETTPEYFYSILERQFRLTFIDILRFNAALDTLQ